MTMILTDMQIRALANPIRFISQPAPMIHPFAEAEHRPGVISYGLSSFGYDARLGDTMKLAVKRNTGMWGSLETIDPKDTDPNLFEIITPWSGTNHIILPPHSFALGHTVERFRMPPDVMAICLGKSTYARCGLIVNVTPLEPGWEGQVTIEISNTTDSPAKVYAGEGICQFLFLRGSEAPEVNYATRPGGAGKYQGQEGVTLPRMVQS